MNKNFWSLDVWSNDTIAVVNTNLGSASLSEYAEGFLETARIVITEMVEKRCSPDLVMPAVLYNIRHSVELFLKSILAEAGISVTNHILKVTFDKHRNDLLNYFENEVLARPFAYAEWLKAFEGIITFVDEFDKDGQTLRYPTNRAGIPNLGGKANVSTSDVFCRIEYIKSYYDEYRDRTT